ncbi:MAG: preprotein translocase subunit SecE [Elusimicrobia bacterium RIFOXYA2_FULL_69_6]|jgi:preprotein translocase subunit SecE|nr:MAG: preprotein translocase subunit SecE [Elusimicrobia bacterium RIFOXYA2_FULL_69_6]
MNIAVQFLKESFYELKKATWLSRQEAVQSTYAVLLIVMILALYVACIDFVLSNLFIGPLLGR